MCQCCFEDIDQEDVCEIFDGFDMFEILFDCSDISVILCVCVQKLLFVYCEIINFVYYYEKFVEEVGKIIGIFQSMVKMWMFYVCK